MNRREEYQNLIRPIDIMLATQCLLIADRFTTSDATTRNSLIVVACPHILDSIRAELVENGTDREMLHALKSKVEDYYHKGIDIFKPSYHLKVCLNKKLDNVTTF